MAKRGIEMEELNEAETGIEADNAAVEDAILAEFGQDPENVSFQLRVYKIESTQGRAGINEQWLFNCDPSELPILDRLRDGYGSGIYRVRVYKNKKLYRSFDYRILTEQKKPTPAYEPPRQYDGLRELAEMIREQNGRLMQFFSEQLARNQQPQNNAADPLTMMERMSTIMANLGGRSAGAGVTEIVSIMKTGMDMATQARAGSSGEGKERGLLDTFVDALNSPVVEKLLSSRLGAMPQTRMVVEETPQQITTAAPASIPAPNAAELQAAQTMAGQIDKQMNLLIEKAQRNANPELWAETVLDDLPPPALQFILTTPNILDVIAAQKPQVNTYRWWFDELLAHMKKMVQGDGQAAEGDAAQ